MKICSPRQLAMDLLDRSQCAVQVACVLVDPAGRIFAWGWNHAGPDGFGTHAEEYAINRSNLRRLAGARAVVAGMRGGRRYVTARPCGSRCWPLLASFGVATVEYTVLGGGWREERVA